MRPGSESREREKKTGRAFSCIDCKIRLVHFSFYIAPFPSETSVFTPTTLQGQGTTTIAAETRLEGRKLRQQRRCSAAAAVVSTLSLFLPLLLPSRRLAPLRCSPSTSLPPPLLLQLLLLLQSSFPLLLLLLPLPLLLRPSFPAPPPAPSASRFHFPALPPSPRLLFRCGCRSCPA